MIQLKVSDEYLELYPGTQIQRERMSPFFLSKTSSGKDGIQGEVSYPFNIPLTDKNMRLLGHPDFLPAERQRVVDSVVYDEITQFSAGKLQLGKNTISLNRNNIGSIQGNLLCNSSAFARIIENKKLSELELDGARSWPWGGYNTTPGHPGFWRHCHDTWDYNSCDDGDYVFFPVTNKGYLGYCEFQNRLCKTLDGARIELDQGFDNVTGLTPHIFMVYIIRKIFEEHGYTVSGEILEDPDFKTLCLLSFRGVYWSEVRPYDPPGYNEQTPLSTVTIRLSEHVPPDVTIGEFLVELQKFLPLGFDINDNSRHCTIRTLGKPSSSAFLKNMTGKVSPNMAITPNKELTSRTMGLKRNYNTDTASAGSTDLTNLDFIETRELDTLPLPVIAPEGAIYRIMTLNEYHVKQTVNGVLETIKVADNTGQYKPEGENIEYIESAIVPTSMLSDIELIAKVDPRGFTNYVYRVPSVTVEGNWQGKPETATFGMHVAFYKGKTYPVNNNGSWLVPYATNTNASYSVGVSEPELDYDGNWSLAYKNGPYGMVEYWWKEWLKILAENEKIEGTMNLSLHEYMQLSWADEILIENTSFILTKVTDVLPFTGTINFEAVRWIKG